MITPQDIQDKVFDKAVRGYNADEVDIFLDEITKDLEALLAEKAAIEEQLREATVKLDEYKAQEGAVVRTLESAKSLMNDISASAEKRADIITKNAELDADRMLRAAKDSVERLREEEQSLASRVNSIQTRFKNILQAELDRFESLNQDVLGIIGLNTDSESSAKEEFESITRVDIPAVSDVPPSEPTKTYSAE